MKLQVAPREITDLVYRACRVAECGASIADQVAAAVTSHEIHDGSGISGLLDVIDGGPGRLRELAIDALRNDQTAPVVLRSRVETADDHAVRRQAMANGVAVERELWSRLDAVAAAFVLAEYIIDGVSTVDGGGPGRTMTDSDNSAEGSDDHDPDAHVDGRSLRRERNIESALDAVLDLAIEGVLDPSWEEVADRAGVSHRSLYRYFEDRSSLLRAAMERSMTRIAPLLDIRDVGTGSLEHRISSFVTARTETYWGFGPIARTAYRRVWEDVVREGLDQIRVDLCAQLVEQFAPELDMLNHSERARTVALLDVAFQFEALEYLAGPLGLGPPELVDALETHLRLHLEPLEARRHEHG